MSDARSKIQALVDQFVTDLEALVREAAIESVERALGGSPAPRATTPTRGKARRKKGQKRTADEIAAAEKRITTYVRDNPGRRVEQIAKALDASTKELALPIQHLLEEGAISKQGVKRATRYFPGRRKATKKRGS